ncbi:MAG: hypothetical protein AAFV53_35235 [Myxococcota bacterium]
MQTPEDQRTTPGWLRLPGLLLLLALGTYSVTAFYGAFNKSPPQVVRKNPYLFWFGTWKMFTLRDPTHSMIEAEVRRGGPWEDLALDELFPYRWESGERYARSSFRKSRGRMSTLAQSACSRYEAAYGERPDEIRFYEVRWRKTRGQLRQPRGKKKQERRKRLFGWECTKTRALPEGTRF